MRKFIFYLVLLVYSIALGQIKFDAEFESGNLKSVTEIDSAEFIVYTNEDIQGRWFYFRMSGVMNKRVKVTVATPPADFTPPADSASGAGRGLWGGFNGNPLVDAVISMLEAVGT